MCPEVFDVSGEVARIRDDADLNAHRQAIHRTMEACPVDAVFVEVEEP
jgi:ferredoxin